MPWPASIWIFKQTQESIAQLLTFGIMLDGALSRREKKSLIELNEQGVLPYTIDEVKKWSNDYFAGRGLEDFFKRTV